MDYFRRNRQAILRYGFFVSIVIAILISMSSLWLNQVFFKSDRLGEITSTALLEESSRESISSLIVDEVFISKPSLRATVGPRLETVVSGLLGTDIASNSVETAVEKLRIALSTDDKQSIAINLTSIKDPIVRVQSVLGRDEEKQKIDTDNVPDEIIILDANNIPDIYGFSIAVLWLGPLCIVFVIAGLLFWIYRGRKLILSKRLRIAGYLGIIASVIALLTGPMTEPVVVRLARKSEGQLILSNLYEALLSPFNQIAITLLIISVLLVLVTFAAPRLPSIDSTFSKKHR